MSQRSRITYIDRRWTRHDAHLWIQPDIERWMKPGVDPVDVIPALAERRAQEQEERKRRRMPHSMPRSNTHAACRPRCGSNPCGRKRDGATMVSEGSPARWRLKAE